MAAFADGVAGGGAVNEGVGAPRGAAVGGFGGEELRAGAGDVAEVEPRGEEAAVGGDGEGVQALAGAAGNVVDEDGAAPGLTGVFGVEGEEFTGHRGDCHGVAVGGDPRTAAAAEHEGGEGGDADGRGEGGAGIVGAGDKNFGAATEGEVDAAGGGGGELGLSGVREFDGGRGGGRDDGREEDGEEAEAED